MKKLIVFLLLMAVTLTGYSQLALPMAPKDNDVCAPPVAIIGTFSCAVGGTSQLTDGTAGGTWSSSSTAIATVGTTGLVTGVSAGAAVITYQVAGGCRAFINFTVTASFATWSPTNKSNAVTLSNSNHTANGSNVYGMCIATVGRTVGSGPKLYFEMKCTTRGSVSESFGLTTQVPNSLDATQTVGRVNQSFGPRPDVGNWDYSYNTGAGWNTSGIGTKPILSGDVVGFAFDLTAGTCIVYINNVLAYTWTGISTGVTWYPAMVSNSGSNIIDEQFDPNRQTYSPPAGYTAGW